MNATLFPELDRFDSEEEARKAYRAAWKRILRRPSFWGLAFLFSVVAPVAASLLLRSVGGWPGMSTGVSSGVTAGVVSAFLAGTYNWVLRGPLRRYLRERLVEQGVPVCLKCGYDLRGQTEPRCPECGEACDSALIGIEPGTGQSGAASSERDDQADAGQQ